MDSHPSRYRGALYTANATAFDALNSFASGWLEWFQDNGYFREFVLWLDCCMDREFTVTPEATFRPRGVFVPAGPTFISFAANRPLKAVERPIEADGGKVHGIFTWTLLQGLKNAVDSTGRVTGRSLGDFLINGMRSFLRPEDLRNSNISKEPEVVKADPSLIFAEGLIPQKSPVSYRFGDDARGKTALVWSSDPPVAEPFEISGSEVSGELGVGLHLIEVPELGLAPRF